MARFRDKYRDTLDITVGVGYVEIEAEVNDTESPYLIFDAEDALAVAKAIKKAAKEALRGA